MCKGGGEGWQAVNLSVGTAGREGPSTVRHWRPACSRRPACIAASRRPDRLSIPTAAPAQQERTARRSRRRRGSAAGARRQLRRAAKGGRRRSGAARRAGRWPGSPAWLPGARVLGEGALGLGAEVGAGARSDSGKAVSRSSDRLQGFRDRSGRYTGRKSADASTGHHQQGTQPHAHAVTQLAPVLAFVPRSQFDHHTSARHSRASVNELPS